MSTDVLAETDFPPDLRERTGKVYISAPRTVDLEPLRSALRQNGFQPISLEDVPVGGSWGDVIREACLMSDFVIAVLDPELDRNVAYEIGVADGLQKPVLTFAAPGKDRELPEETKRRHAYFGPLGATDKLRDQIADVREGVLSARTQPPTIPTSLPLSDRAEACRQQFLAEASGSGDRIESAFSKLMPEMGVGGKITSLGKEVRAEAAVWGGEWEPWVQDPLIVEVWNPHDGEPALGEIVNFSYRLSDRSLGWGMVLAKSFSASVRREAQKLAPYVLLLTYDELFDRLKTTSFPKIVVSLRNQRVHGEG
jgi:nucleoside 2-deoxyribosyltransferase